MAPHVVVFGEEEAGGEMRGGGGEGEARAEAVPAGVGGAVN